MHTYKVGAQVGLSTHGLADGQLSALPVSTGKTQVGKRQERCGELTGGSCSSQGVLLKLRCC